MSKRWIGFRVTITAAVRCEPERDDAFREYLARGASVTEIMQPDELIDEVGASAVKTIFLDHRDGVEGESHFVEPTEPWPGGPTEALRATVDWSWIRSVLAQGGAIQQDYQAGKYPTYEHYAARLDEAAREKVAELERLSGG